MKASPLDMVMMKMAEHQNDRPVFGNRNILETATGINDDLHRAGSQLKTCGVTAKPGKLRSRYRHRTAHTMKSNLHNVPVPMQPRGGSTRLNIVSHTSNVRLYPQGKAMYFAIYAWMRPMPAQVAAMACGWRFHRALHRKAGQDCANAGTPYSRQIRRQTP